MNKGTVVTGNEVVMTYNELRAECLKHGLVVEDSKKETLIAALEAHLNANAGKKGRPVDPNSVRQLMLAEKAARQAEGGVYRGRPVDPNSARQLALASKTPVLDEEGNVIVVERRGRPVDPNSAASIAKAEREARMLAGEVIKRGRPKSLVSKEDAKAANKRFKVVITSASGDKTNYNKSFATEKGAIREMKEAGVDLSSIQLQEFTTAQD